MNAQIHLANFHQTFTKLFACHTNLNLSRNLISSTLNSGLEALPKLKRINLSSNRITSHKMFKPLPLCASLLSLSLKDNRDGSKALSSYRLLVIFMTRHLAGTNRANGIQELDGKPVSIKERIDAVAQFEKKKNFAAFAFETQLVNYLGRAQLRDSKFMEAGNHQMTYFFEFF